jgi:hypothetical protein
VDDQLVNAAPARQPVSHNHFSKQPLVVATTAQAVFRRGLGPDRVHGRADLMLDAIESVAAPRSPTRR